MLILVTGCAGFIGFHVSKLLLERGDSVLGLDNLNDYYDVSLKEARLNILKKHKNFSFVKQNLEELNLDVVPDKICHLAAQAGVRYSLENPFAYESANMLGSLKIFEFAKTNKINHVVFASSSSVYGGINADKFSEDLETNKPISLYAATKKANELYAFTYHHLFGINMTGLRFFTVYGPWGRPDMALFKFTKNILENKPIDVYNNGEMLRDFTYINDIAQGILLALDKPRGYRIYNLARGEQVKLNEFIEQIEINLNKKATKNFFPLQQGDVIATHGDIALAKEELGYSPKTSVREGINEFIKWYIEFYK